MEPLETNRQCLIWLRILPSDESTNRWQKLAHTAFAVLVFTALMCGATSCLVFCLKFLSTDLARSIFAFVFSVGGYSIIYVALVGMILLRHKIGAIFDNLEVIFKDSKYVSPNPTRQAVEQDERAILH